jgi:hypothetical protein
VSGIAQVVTGPFAAARETEADVLVEWSPGHTVNFALWDIVDFAPVGLELEAVENKQAVRAEARQEATGLASAGAAAQHIVVV